MTKPALKLFIFCVMFILSSCASPDSNPPQESTAVSTTVSSAQTAQTTTATTICDNCEEKVTYYKKS